MLHWTDRLVAHVAPGAAVKRAQARMALRAFEAARPSGHRRNRGERRGPNLALVDAGESLREQARELEQNSDLANGVLDALVDNTVGAGIAIEPAVRDVNGDPHESMSSRILDVWNDWEMHADTSGEMHFDELQRLAARAMFKDGEMFARRHRGRIPGIAHTATFPFALETLEADHVPLDERDEGRRIHEGIQRNGWGAPRAFFFYDVHPGEGFAMARTRRRLRRVPAEDVLHLKLVSRFGQRRGVSLFASIMKRLQDIDEIEETERIAAKVAASFAAFIKKGSGEFYVAPDSDGDGYRELELQPGIIFDDLEPGEDVGTIASNRPNNALIDFRASQLRAVASGTGTSYSTIARDYAGTYSSQRQSLVEAFMHYRALSRLFIANFVRPLYRDWLQTMLAGDVIQLEPGVDTRTLLLAEMRGPAMPWIDPVKEANGEILQIQAGLKSRSQSIRERGGNPRDTFEQLRRERARDSQAGLVFSSTEQQTKAPASPDAGTEDADDEDRHVVAGLSHRITS